jgi:hypothetical protein
LPGINVMRCERRRSSIENATVSANQSHVDSERPGQRRHPTLLAAIVLLIVPALVLGCAFGPLQRRSDDPPVADYTLGPHSLHSTPVYVACPRASPAPCYTRWYVIHVLVELPALGTWGLDIWAPFVDSQMQARDVYITLAVWYHGTQLGQRIDARE